MRCAAVARRTEMTYSAEDTQTDTQTTSDNTFACLATEKVITYYVLPN